MTFSEAVRAGLSQYATFSGRATRSEFWAFVLFSNIVYFVAAALDIALFFATGLPIGIFTLITALALLLPGLAVAVRRLHDTGRSGWWYLIALVPLVGPIVLLVFLVEQGPSAANRYGGTGEGADPQAADHGAALPEPVVYAVFAGAFVAAAVLFLVAAAVDHRSVNPSGVDGLGLVFVWLAAGFGAVATIWLASAVLTALVVRRSA